MARLVPRRYSKLGKWRFSGEFGGPCKYGHNEGRYSSGGCKVCSRERSAKRAAAEKEARAKLTPAARERRLMAKEQDKRAAAKAFHQQWLVERRQARAERLSKQRLDLVAKLLS